MRASCFPLNVLLDIFSNRRHAEQGRQKYIPCAMCMGDTGYPKGGPIEQISRYHEPGYVLCPKCENNAFPPTPATHYPEVPSIGGFM